MSPRDIEEFERAYAGIRAKVIKVLYARASSWGHATVENLADEVLARTWKEWARIRDEPLHWALKTAGNLVIDERRRRGREADPIGLVVDDEGASVLVAPITRPDERGDFIDVIRAMKKMPKSWQEAVLYTQFAGMSAEEAAGVMRCRPATVQSYVSKARRALERRTQHPRPRPRSPESESNNPGVTDRMNEEIQ